MEKKITYWLEISDYDLDTAEAMLKSKRYLYVGFMCHQTVEKALKAYYVFIKNEIPPYTHNLMYLCELTGLKDILSEAQEEFANKLMPLNIEARYPSYNEQLLKSLSEKICTEIITVTKKLQKWIKQKLSVS